MTETTAQERHATGRPYVALIGGMDAPRYVVDVAGDWISVDILDSVLRKLSSYDFKRVGSDKLFLKGAYFYTYCGESNSATSTRIINFHENGRAVIAEQTAATIEAKEHEVIVPVEGNWQRFPSFGEYMMLCEVQSVSV